MKLKLFILTGQADAPEYSPDHLPLTVGRSRKADIRLVDPMASRRHCEIGECDGEFYVRDLDSLNGTFVGNKRITDSPLRDNDLVTIGSCTLRAVVVGPQQLQSANVDTVSDLSRETVDLEDGSKAPSQDKTETPGQPKKLAPLSDVERLNAVRTGL